MLTSLMGLGIEIEDGPVPCAIQYDSMPLFGDVGVGPDADTSASGATGSSIAANMSRS